MAFFSYKPKKRFSGSQGNFTPSNPFYDKILSLKRGKRNWQLAFLIMSFFFGVTLFSYFRLANRTTLVPFVVEIDKEKNVNFVGRMDQVTYVANDSVIFAILSDHVINTRSISLDRVFTYKKMKRQYSFLGKDMKNKMNYDINSMKLEKKFKDRETTDVQITSLLKTAENIYQVNWTEKYYTNGSYNNSKKWTANFSIISDYELSEEDLLINPLGIIIQDYHISIDLSE